MGATEKKFNERRYVPSVIKVNEGEGLPCAEEDPAGVEVGNQDLQLCRGLRDSGSINNRTNVLLFIGGTMSSGLKI